MLFSGRREEDLISGECVVDYVALCQKLWNRLCEISGLKYKSFRGMVISCFDHYFTVRVAYVKDKLVENLLIEYRISEGKCVVYGIYELQGAVSSDDIGRLIKGYMFNIYRSYLSISMRYKVDNFILCITSGGESVSKINKNGSHLLVYVRCSLERLLIKKPFIVSKSELHDVNMISSIADMIKL